MSLARQTLDLLTAFVARVPPMQVQALHLPPPALADGLRGEFCALSLDDGSLGLSYGLLEGQWPALQAAAPGLALAGQPALAVAAGILEPDPLRRTLGWAAVNALTRSLYQRAGFSPPASVDSLGHLDPQPGERIGMVGHFTPLMPRLLERGARLLVVELRPELVRDDGQVRVTLDAGELATCHKVLATGAMLLNGTLEATLAHLAPGARVALIGPSVGGPPDPLFQRGISLLGGTWITDPAAYLAALQAGAPAQGSRKFSLTPADHPGWPALLARL